jgi:flagellar biosynthetic protein FliQ
VHIGQVAALSQEIETVGRTMGDMSMELVLTMSSDMVWTAIKIAAPLIGATLLAGLAVSILQVVTQIQESSLTFVPKLIVAAAILLLLGGWMLTTLGQFAVRLISGIPNYL